jgi:hypothetical protein
MKAVDLLMEEPPKPDKDDQDEDGGFHVEFVGDFLTKRDRLEGWLSLAKFVYPTRKALEGILAPSGGQVGTIRPLQLCIVDAVAPEQAE